MVAISAGGQTLTAALPVAAALPAATGRAVAAGASGVAMASAGDSVALSAVAQSLSGDAASLFAAFSGDDRQRLAQAVESGAVSAEELNDGLSGAMKGERKRQLWKLVAAKVQELPGLDLSKAPKGWSPDITSELEALGQERGRTIMEVMRLSFEGASAAAIKEKAEALQQLETRHAELSRVLFWDMTQPMTLIGASGQFFSANWQSDAEHAAQETLEKRGLFSAGVKEAIAAAGKQAAAENIIIQRVN